MMTLQQIRPWLVGLVQSAMVLCYILLFTLAAQTVRILFGNKPDNPFIAMPIFLTVFVFSALVCGGAVLGYPLLLLFERNVRRAVTVVCWSAVWLGAFLGTALAIAIGVSL